MNRLTCFVIWEFTSKGGWLSPSRKSTPVSLPSSLMALILRVPWNHLDDLLNTHIHTHSWAAPLEFLTLSWDPGMLPSHQFPRMLMLLVWEGHTRSTNFATWPSVCPSSAQTRSYLQELASAVPSVWSWPRGLAFILCSERPCLNIQENIVFPFPAPQCHIPWFRSSLDFCHSLKLPLCGCLKGNCDWWRDTNTPGQRMHVSFM